MEGIFYVMRMAQHEQLDSGMVDRLSEFCRRMARPHKGTHMTNQPAIVHKTYTVQLISYRRKIGWIPRAIVKLPERDGKGYTIAENPKDLLPTHEAADAVAKKLAIEWIDAQFPSAAD